MDSSAKGFSELIFQQTIQGNMGKLDLDGVMLGVLMKLNGSRTLGQVTQECNLSLMAIRPIITKLLNHKLVKHVVLTTATSDPEFMSFLISQLSIAVGPLGEIILEESLEDLGFTKRNFPVNRAAELINILSQDIPREDKRIEFKQAMLQRIQKFN